MAFFTQKTGLFRFLHAEKALLISIFCRCGRIFWWFLEISGLFHTKKRVFGLRRPPVFRERERLNVGSIAVHCLACASFPADGAIDFNLPSTWFRPAERQFYLWPYLYKDSGCVLDFFFILFDNRRACHRKRRPQTSADIKRQQTDGVI